MCKWTWGLVWHFFVFHVGACTMCPHECGYWQSLLNDIICTNVHYKPTVRLSNKLLLKGHLISDVLVLYLRIDTCVWLPYTHLRECISSHCYLIPLPLSLILLSCSDFVRSNTSRLVSPCFMYRGGTMRVVVRVRIVIFFKTYKQWNAKCSWCVRNCVLHVLFRTCRQKKSCKLHKY